MSDRRCDRHGVYHEDWCPECGPPAAATARDPHEIIAELQSKLHERDAKLAEIRKILSSWLIVYEELGEGHTPLGLLELREALRDD